MTDRTGHNSGGAKVSKMTLSAVNNKKEGTPEQRSFWMRGGEIRE
ncbi:hypothetical protein [Deinococcus ruber]|nr:hypothetical protein [Deinococcus ruber]